MDSPKLCILFSTLLLLASIVAAAAQIDGSTFQITTDFLQETGMPAFYDEEYLGEGMDGDGEEITSISLPNRRSLLWKRVFRYYISYGALAANRIPCPPRSGRSYYTHNCYRASGPVRPYYRGCSAITRCRR